VIILAVVTVISEAVSATPLAVAEFATKMAITAPVVARVAATVLLALVFTPGFSVTFAARLLAITTMLAITPTTVMLAMVLIAITAVAGTFAAMTLAVATVTGATVIAVAGAVAARTMTAVT